MLSSLNLTQALPLVAGGLVVDVGSHVLDLVLAQATGPGGHGVLAIGDLHAMRHQQWSSLPLLPILRDLAFMIENH